MDGPAHTDVLGLPGRVLAIGAHPDDVEFGCGGTLGRWARAGSDVDVAVLTDGSKGTWEPEADLPALVAERKREQRRAADELGVRDLHFLDFVDGELEAGSSERAAVCELVRRVRPELVLTHDPWKRYRIHPDHARAGELVLAAIVAARDPHFFPGQGLPPHRPRRLLLFEAEVVDHVEPLAEEDLETKVSALLCHRSQWRSTMDIDPRSADIEARRDAFASRIRQEAETLGTEHGVGLAEGFKLIDRL